MALKDTTPGLNLGGESFGLNLFNEPSNETPSVDADNKALSKEERRKKREAKGLLRKTKRTQKIRGHVLDDKTPDETPPIDVNDNSDSSLNLNLNLNLQNLNLSTSIPALSLSGPELDEVTGPVKPPKEDGWGIKTLDFLFGTEAAVIGIAHDSEGWSWSVENMKQQWSEQPTWVNLLGVASIAGTIVWPATRALRMSAQFGKLATKTAGKAGEAKQISTWKQDGLIDGHINSYADFGKDADKTVSLLRKNDYAMNNYKDMAKRADAVARGDTTWVSSPGAMVKHQFDKRFANKYADAIDMFGTGDNARKTLNSSLDSMFKSEEVGWLLTNLPDDKAMPKIQAYMMGRLNPELAGRATKEFGKLSAIDKKFADYYYDAATIHQKKMLEDGVITAAEYKAMGEIHLPALNVGTQVGGVGTTRTQLIPVGKKNLRTKAATLGERMVPATGVLNRVIGRKVKKEIIPIDELEYLPINLVKTPRLDSVTLMKRKKSVPEAFESLKKGQLITAAHDTTVNGYVTDRLLHTNFLAMRDIAMDPMNIASADAIAAWGGSAAKAAEAGFIKLSYAGDNVAGRLQRMIAKKRTGNIDNVEDLPWIRKHVFDDLYGENGMMQQSRHAASDMMDVATTIYKTMKTSGNIPTHMQNFAGNMVFLMQAGFNPMKAENIALMGKMGGVFNNMAKIKAAAKKAGVDDTRILNPDSSVIGRVNLGTVEVNGKTFNLNEEMFDPVVRELIEESAFDAAEGSGRLARIADGLGKDQYATRAVIKAYDKTKSFLQVGDRVKWFDGLSKAYLAEDMVPKMAYFMSLRGQGLTRKAAAIEVARRLPMYNTVGSSIKKGRKLVFPWATFPAEAVRITKNNMLDHPLRMIPWLRAPQVMQGMISGMGMGPETRGETEESMTQLPTWAQTPTTVVMEGKAAGLFSGGTTGGLVGGAAGALLGKSGSAAAAGAAAGAAFGTLVASLTTDTENEGQLRGALMDFLPHSTFMLANTSEEFGGDIVPFKDFQGLLEQMPAEPFAIMKPLLEVWSGEDAYGNPVGSGPGGGIAKAMAGMIGFMAPPIIQKYGFKVTTPEVPIPGDPTGITNVSRLLVDTGRVVNPSTGMPGNFGHDFLLNNFAAWKTYAASGEQQLANESRTERHLGEVRSHMTKNLSFHLQNGNDKETVEILSGIQGTFTQQYLHDPRLANSKYYEWLERHQKQLGRHPKLRNWTEEELINRLRLAGHAAGEARSAARNTLLQALRDEMRVRGAGGASTPSGGMKSTMKSTMKGGMG